jgi:phosphohistidine swiveling domain-containing protein
VANGHRVPPGLVLTVDAFKHTCRSLGLAGELDGLRKGLAQRGDVARLGASVAGGLLAGRLPVEVLEQLEQAIDHLGLWRQNPWGLIVRSSATVEDSAAHSFAGIFESTAVPAADALEPTIRSVWASAFSPRAMVYYREVGLDRPPEMAVVVQRFLEAQRSGVMFTTFRGRTLVEHVEGGCEKLVKGETTPEQLWMDSFQPPADAGKLPSEYARDLARLAKDLERQFGGPQDVEWVLCDDALHVVQSRPITTGASTAESAGASAQQGPPPALTGTPASGGRGAGPVHLVFNIENALELESGQVLVTPMTNPDMVVAMRKSAAIVTDVGGMICHAAIVSRELGLPCVVGTEKATQVLRAGEPVTVDGTAGAVYRGRLELLAGAEKRRGEWSDVWAAWRQAGHNRDDVVPILSSLDALRAAPAPLPEAVLAPGVDLRTGPTGLWVDLEGLGGAEARALLLDYAASAAACARELGVGRLWVWPEAGPLAQAVAGAVIETGAPLRLLGDDPKAPGLLLEPVQPLPAGKVAVPLAAAALLDGTAPPSKLGPMEEARAAALDTIKFFGHQPGSVSAAMPEAGLRRSWWELLPEYGRFHAEYGTADQSGEHVWLEVRPELVISALLKSLVQPGFEMVPRVMGLGDIPPMHIKWVKCRYYFRADTFGRVWQGIVRATWDTKYMAGLMRRVRASYDQLAEVLALFPTSDAALAELTPERIVALITSWWPRWVEFFALCWFIQAQGDDILYPFIQETVGDNLKRLASRRDGFAWPDAADLVAPTTPVLSGEYMADVGALRETLHSHGLNTLEQALAALAGGTSPALARKLEQHLARWHWMRDRDLLFEPWDTAERVIETALKTESHPPVPYRANLRRNRLALAVHCDLAYAAGRAQGLNHAARFLHDLNVERENHHILWLKFSYPLRRLFLEVERRLVAAGSLRQGDIFFLQAPELIAATRRLPEPLPDDLVRRVKNRRLGYRYEARLVEADPATITRENDYY